MDFSGNQRHETRTVWVIDSNAPVITLNGPSYLTIEANLDDNFTELGATCYDDTDGQIDENIVITHTPFPVNLRYPRTYYIQYNCADNRDGNSYIAAANRVNFTPGFRGGFAANTVIRTIFVQDTTAPQVRLLNNLSDYSMTWEAGYAWDELGWTARDSLSGDLTSNVSVDAVNIFPARVPDEQHIEYWVDDEAGNRYRHGTSRSHGYF
jgi:hypothetical protein